MVNIEQTTVGEGGGGGGMVTHLDYYDRRKKKEAFMSINTLIPTQAFGRHGMQIVIHSLNSDNTPGLL